MVATFGWSLLLLSERYGYLSMVDRNINIERKIVLGKTFCIRQPSITYFCNEGHLKLQNYELQNYKLHVFDIEFLLCQILDCRVVSFDVPTLCLKLEKSCQRTNFYQVSYLTRIKWSSPGATRLVARQPPELLSCDI